MRGEVCLLAATGVHGERIAAKIGQKSPPSPRSCRPDRHISLPSVGPGRSNPQAGHLPERILEILLDSILEIILEISGTTLWGGPPPA
jgi:hypothetical protein